MEDCPTIDDVLKTPKQFWSALGAGAQGSVYKIKDYVVKIMALRSERERQAFELEKSILEKFADNPRIRPFIPKLCSIETSESMGIHKGYILQKYEKVVNLREYIEDHKESGEKMDFQLARKFIRNLIESILILQINGYLHRDIKPENILIRTEGEIEKPILIDFGLTCKLPCEGVGAGGTPQFLPQNFLPPFMRTIPTLYKVKTNILPMKPKKMYDKYAMWLTIQELLPVIDFESGTEEELKEKQAFKQLMEKNIRDSKREVFLDAIRIKGKITSNKYTTNNTRRRLENLNTSVRNKLLKPNGGGSRKLKRKTRKSTY